MSELNFSKTYETIVPTKKEAAIAEQSIKLLSAYMKSTKHPMLELLNSEHQKKQITLPESALHLLLDILALMAKGNAVTLIPSDVEVTTQKAADMLKVSRPYLVELLKQGKIPFRKVGTKRRILASDLLHYKEKIDNARLKVLEKLAEQAQELDMGY